MNAPLPTVPPLRLRMLEDMRMRRLAPKTQSDYIRAVRRFTAYLHRPPDTATVEDLRNFQLYLVDQGTSPTTLNANLTGLKFFCEITLDRAELTSKMQPVHVPRTLPVVLSRQEAARLIARQTWWALVQCEAPTGIDLLEEIANGEDPSEYLSNHSDIPPAWQRAREPGGRDPR